MKQNKNRLLFILLFLTIISGIIAILNIHNNYSFTSSAKLRPINISGDIHFVADSEKQKTKEYNIEISLAQNNAENSFVVCSKNNLNPIVKLTNDTLYINGQNINVSDLFSGCDLSDLPAGVYSRLILYFADHIGEYNINELCYINRTKYTTEIIISEDDVLNIGNAAVSIIERYKHSLPSAVFYKRLSDSDKQNVDKLMSILESKIETAANHRGQNAAGYILNNSTVVRHPYIHIVYSGGTADVSGSFILNDEKYIFDGCFVIREGDFNNG